MKPTQAVAALALLAAPLAAQQRDSGPAHPRMGHQEMEHGMMPGMGAMEEMMRPMMRAMAFTPEHLLARKDALGLSPDQITRLGAIRTAAKSALDAAATDAKTHMTAVAETMKAAAPDTATLRQHFQAAHAAMGNAHWAMLRAAAQGRAVLTDAQRGRVEGWVDAMEMRREHEGRQHEEPRH